MTRSKLPDSRNVGKSVSPVIDVAILNTIDQAISDRHSTLTEDERLIIALYILLTYCYEDFGKIPYLHIASLNPGEGKSEIADILRDLCNRPQIIFPTVASLSIFKDNGNITLILDEMHLLLSSRATDTDAFYALVNLGNRPGNAWQVSSRNIPGETDDRDTFFPKIFIGIGPGILKEPLAQRSIRIVLKAGTVEDQRIRESNQQMRPPEILADRIRKSLSGLFRLRELHEYLQESGKSISTRTLNDGTELYNRPADLWRPLIAIADAINAEIGKRIRAIAADRESSEPEYIPTIAETFDAEFRKAMRSGRIIVSSWLSESKAPLPNGDWPVSNRDFGWNHRNGQNKDRLPGGTLLFNAEIGKAELRFKARDWKEICAGLKSDPREIKQAYLSEQRLTFDSGHTTTKKAFHKGESQTAIVAIDVSIWIWPDGLFADRQMVAINEAQTVEEIWKADI